MKALSIMEILMSNETLKSTERVICVQSRKIIFFMFIFLSFVCYIFSPSTVNAEDIMPDGYRGSFDGVTKWKDDTIEFRISLEGPRPEGSSMTYRPIPKYFYRVKVQIEGKDNETKEIFLNEIWSYRVDRTSEGRLHLLLQGSHPALKNHKHATFSGRITDIEHG